MNLEAEVSRLVRQAVEAFILQHEPTGTDKSSKHVLIIQADKDHAEEIHRFVSGLMDHCQPTLAYCGKDSWPYDEGIVSNGMYPVIGGPALGDRSAWDAAARDADLIVFPIVRVGALARIASLLNDEPATGTFIAAMMSGKDTAISGSFLWPAGTGKLNVPAALHQTVSAHLRKLSEYGVKVVSFRKLNAVVKSWCEADHAPKRPLVLAHHVRDWAEEGETRIQLPPGSVITALAKDEANRLGLKWNAVVAGKEE